MVLFYEQSFNTQSMKSLVVLIFMGLLLFSPQVFAQRGFNDYGTHHDIRIQYRWARQNPFDQNSNAALVLRLTNNREYAVIANFSVNFYRNGQLIFESRENNYCMEPGQSIRGAYAYLRFMAEGITLPMTGDPAFDWNIGDVTVKRVESCR